MATQTKAWKRKTIAGAIAACLLAASLPIAAAAADPAVNLALNKTAAASSFNGEDFVPGKANDGIYYDQLDTVPGAEGNAWCTALEQGVGSWWQVDLEKVYDLSEVKIQWRRYKGDTTGSYNHIPSKLVIQVSSNGTSWTDAATFEKIEDITVSDANFPGCWLVPVANTERDLYSYELTEAVGRYLRLSFPDGTPSTDGIGVAQGGPIIQLQEVEVYGEEIPVPTLTAGTAERNSDTAATVKFTSSKPGSYYYAVVADGAAAPAIDMSGAGTACVEGENIITLSSLADAAAKDIYIQVKDSVGNVSAAIKIDIPAKEAPVVEPPVLSAGTASRADAKKASVKFTSDKAGSYYYAVVENGAAAPKIDISGAGMTAAAGENTIELKDLKNASAKDVYIQVKAADGSVSAALKVDVPMFASLISKGKTASASTVLDGNTDASKAVDGVYYSDNDQNFWCSAPKSAAPDGTPQWWQVDLGKVSELSEIKVQYRRFKLDGENAGKGMYHFTPTSVTVLVSNDGSTWKTVVSKSKNVPECWAIVPDSDKGIFTYTLDGASGRYVRLLFEEGTVDNDFDGPLIQLHEVEVYGAAAVIPETGTNEASGLFCGGILLMGVLVLGAWELLKRKRTANSR